jgi:uncharacterized protein YyaL (SSP411 family)
MLAAFAEAARALEREDGSRALAASYRQVAERNAEFLLRELRQEHNRLLRTRKRRPERVLEGPSEGAGEAKLNGYLEDYSYLIESLLELYQTTFEPRWYLAAHELTETMLAHFQAPGGGFYDTSDDHEALITGKPHLAFSLAEAPHGPRGFCTRPRDLQDNAKLSAKPIASVRQCDGCHRPAQAGRLHE